jgi:hypothetical protein
MGRQRKMTAQELTTMIKSHEQMLDLVNTRIDYLAQAIMYDFERIQILVMSLLAEQGYLKDEICDCGKEYVWPDIGGRIPTPKGCPACASVPEAAEDGTEEE